MNYSDTHELKFTPLDPPAQPSEGSRLKARQLLWWLAVALAGVALQATLTTRCDRAFRGLADSLQEQSPANPAQPFVATRLEAQLKARYREPDFTGPAAAVASSPTARQRPAELSDAIMVKASKFYAIRCASCHGDKGDGKGPAADMVKPAPRSFLDATWQESTSDETVNKAILKGGLAVGKSYMMPGAYDLHGKPDMVKALGFLVRSFPDAP